VSRPLRIELPDAIYHVTSRGDRREPIFVDDTDRAALLGVVGQAAERFDARALAYCLMGNHYHFVLHTRAANLSRLMRHVNGVFTQRFNRRHGKVGHLFQGRFKAILVDRDSYLLEVCRYVELNPVRAGLVPQAQDWSWSSFRTHTGQAPGFDWLDTPALLGFVLGREVTGAADLQRAQVRYAQHVAAGLGVQLWEQALRQQIYLGDDRFVERMQALEARSRHGLAPPATRRSEVPRTQRQPPRARPDIAALTARGVALDEALRASYRAGGATKIGVTTKIGVRSCLLPPRR
jgi:putative transposase